MTGPQSTGAGLAGRPNAGEASFSAAEEPPRVTLIVTPRERFGVAKESLESIYAQSDIPFDLVYVDGNSPAELAGWLKQQATERSFRLLQSDRYLSPNEARNMGLRAAKSDYVVFIDNDVICSPGWLGRLVATADETGAEVVSPLTCQGLPLHTQIHQAGATFTDDLPAFFAIPPGERILKEEMLLQGAALGDAPEEPIDTHCCEFHCVLVRRDLFDRMGELDEEMLSTKEHVDFCMGVLHDGGRVLLEPRSIVTYLFPNRARPITREDWPYFLVRWSVDWQNRSLDRLAEKWGLKPDQPYLVDRRRKVWIRYEEGLVKPLVRKVPFTSQSDAVRITASKLIRRAFKVRGRTLTARVSKQLGAKRDTPGPRPAAG